MMNLISLTDQNDMSSNFLSKYNLFARIMLGNKYYIKLILNKPGGTNE